ncbi:response regulator [Nitratidesulfovibrio liaohensis]|uniref:histidine kinase n=1 Tax=Nitratidesulfovibrio liaohensis TaxID=2604158 RepID=A0ABY9QZR7_9BACT|nr:response regulator [Nitratidesulfovibrio liaohensis]WMW65020.1 response regulator [Nitratidesulfovibrio liaohensis]
MTQQQPLPDSGRPSVVIVDDEQIVALDIRRTLERLGYAVPAMAADGEEAVRMAGELRPDLVLMDIRLRGPMDGIEAAGRIAGQYGVPVVFLTAFSDAATLERAKACGPFGFLVKPFEERELHSTIEVALLKHRAVRDLDDARRIAENASIAKSAFLAGMSHEIRNSLNGILGMTDLALESAEDEEQRDHLVTVLESAETLLALLNDVLDFSRLEARQIRLVERPFEPAAVVRKVMRSVQSEAARRGLALSWRVAPEIPPVLAGDQVRLTQVLANLVGNAVKFTHAGVVSVEVAPVPSPPSLFESLFPPGEPGGATLLFTVRDTGIGIAEDRLESIFELYAQASDDTGATYGGSGLGLSICRQLVGMMGGSIWARSTPGVGSSFHFTCRLRPAPAPQAEAVSTMRRRAPDAPSASGTTQVPGRSGISVPGGAEPRPTAGRGPVAMPGALVRLLDPVPSAPPLQSVPPAVAQPAEPAGPAARPDPHPGFPHAVPQPDEPAARSLHVLVADDSEVARTIAARLLQRRGHTCATAQDGVEALTRLATERFDLVLLNMEMPRMNGFETLRRIRNSMHPGVSPALPVVAMTAHAPAGDHERMLAAGMDGYVAKPIQPAAFHEEIERVARLAGLVRQG